VTLRFKASFYVLAIQRLLLRRCAPACDAPEACQMHTDLFILLIAYSSVERILLVLDSNFRYSYDHGGDGVLDRTHNETGVIDY